LQAFAIDAGGIDISCITHRCSRALESAGGIYGCLEALLPGPLDRLLAALAKGYEGGRLLLIGQN
jgi:hypothetical protein